eukprot:gene12073-14125_t
MINVYEGIKGVKKVKSLSSEDMLTGSNLGAMPSGVTMLLSKTHVEFAVTLEGRRPQTDDVLWLGFHFSGSFQKLQNIRKLTKRNIRDTIYTDTFNGTKAYWTVSLPDNPQRIFGHIPLHRADSYHSLQSYPILYLEGDMQVILGTDLDRNQMYPSYPAIDTLYTQTLRNIEPILAPHKWSVTVIPTAKPSATPSATDAYLTRNSFDLDKLSRWFLKKFNASHPLTFVYGLSFYKRGGAKTIDMLTLKSSPTGKTYIVNMVHTFRLSPHLDYFKDGEVARQFESENLARYTSDFAALEAECTTIKSLVPATSVSIYNPFFDKFARRTLKCLQPLTIESKFLTQPVSASTTTPSSSSSTTTTTTSDVTSPRKPPARSSTPTTPKSSIPSPVTTAPAAVDTNLLASIVGQLLAQQQQQH